MNLPRTKKTMEVKRLVAEDIMNGAANVVLGGAAFIIVVKVLQALITLL